MKQSKKDFKKRTEPESRHFNSRYDKQTIQKLTGAILEGQGNKVTFD
jgi:hypothetical protein